MKVLIWLLLICSCFANPLMAENIGTISGKVTDTGGQGLPNVEVKLLNTQKGTSTNDKGHFQIQGLKSKQYQIEVSAVGYHRKKRTIDLSNKHQVNLDFTLKPTVIQMDAMVVTGTKEASYVKESPVKVEVMNQKFLSQNPTNNVMESISQSNGVDQQVNCGVCGTNALRINGMEGPYTLMLIDGMPIMSNLASVYGLNGIPNSLVNQIEIVKGPNSTLYGTEAMGGVINVRTKRPEELPLLSFNSHYTSHRELNADLTFSPDVGENVQTTFSANYFGNDQKFDFNDDQFTDLVINDRISLFNKWQIDRPDDKKASIAGRYYREDRLGGTMDFEHAMRGNDSIYGESIQTERFEVIGQYDLPFDNQNLKLDFSYSHHDQDSYYGTEHYLAEQSTAFANLLWDKRLGDHDLLGGLTARWEQYEDNSPAETNFNSLIPGVFLQDEWDISSDFTLLSGARLDFHEAHGTIFSPRLNAKYKWDEWTSIRLNLGSGFRQVHLFTEDHAALTGTREVTIREDLKPERSFNATLNFHHIYQAGEGGTGNINLDLFYNHFTNKITPDYDTDPNLVIYRNLRGYGVTRGASLSVGHDFKFPLKLKLAGTYQNAFQVNTEGSQAAKDPIPFTPVFSGNFSAQYNWKNLGLSFAYTGTVTGPQDLPQFEPPFQRPQKSSWYSIQNLKVAKNLNHNVEIYGGVKNILNWTQPTPLIDPGNPFGENFDTIYAYGPLQPRRVYLGLKWHWDKE